MKHREIAEELLNIVFYQTLKKEIINIHDIDKIIDIVVNRLGLNDLINTMFIDKDKNPNRISGYCSKNKELYINYKRILNYAVDTINHRKLYNNLEENIFEINLMILKVVLHELEHVHQIRIVENIDRDIENMLLQISCEPFIKVNEKLRYNEECYYKDFRKYLHTSRGYTVDPAERYASIKPCYLICDFLNYLQGYDMVKEYAERDLNRELLSGYINLDSGLIIPTEEFLKNQKRLLLQNDLERNNEELLPLMDKEHDLSRRLYHGIKISKEEYLQYKDNR